LRDIERPSWRHIRPFPHIECKQGANSSSGKKIPTLPNLEIQRMVKSPSIRWLILAFLWYSILCAYQPGKYPRASEGFLPSNKGLRDSGNVFGTIECTSRKLLITKQWIVSFMRLSLGNCLDLRNLEFSVAQGSRSRGKQST